MNDMTWNYLMASGGTPRPQQGQDKDGTTVSVKAIVPISSFLQLLHPQRLITVD